MLDQIHIRHLLVHTGLFALRAGPHRVVGGGPSPTDWRGAFGWVEASWV